MRLVRYAIHKLTIFIQFFLVLLFILFEELIWEEIAEPIYYRIRSLKFLKRMEELLEYTPKTVILLLFLLIFVSVEAAGITAGIFILQGKIILGTLLYLSKIPIAAFTFWLFNASKDKLLSFGWFAWIYEKLTAIFDWVKSRRIYKDTMKSLGIWKRKIRIALLRAKGRFLSDEGRLISALKLRYRRLKSLMEKYL